MSFIILVIHVLAALGVIGLVLMQHGKGADMGAAFGSGSSGSLFGASGSANFLSRTTAIFATVFFLTSMGLSFLQFEATRSMGVMSDVPAATSEVPAQDTVSEPAQEGESEAKVDDIPE
jgi:preprotein translocase subunit SecG